MIPAVMVNQIAAKTGAVVRNFFMMAEEQEGRGIGLEAGLGRWIEPLGQGH